MGSSPISVDLLPHFDFDHLYAHGWIDSIGCFYLPSHLSKNHPNPDASRFSSAHFFQVFFFQWFSNHFQHFDHFQHVLRPRKEHSGGLWLTNLCSQKCLWAMGSPPTWPESGSPTRATFVWKQGCPKMNGLWMEHHIKFGLFSMDETHFSYFLWMNLGVNMASAF